MNRSGFDADTMEAALPYSSNQEHGASGGALFTHDQEKLWRALFARHGYSHHQSPDFIAAFRAAYPTAKLVTIVQGDPGREMISAFTLKNDLGVCLFESLPFLSAHVPTQAECEAFFQKALSRLCAKALYLPLAYQHFPAVQALRGMKEIAVLQRSPSPYVRWTDGGASLWEGVCQRLGGIARRRMRNFKALGCHCDWEGGERACETLAVLESRSWKATVKQDMSARDQLRLYQRLLKDGVLKLYAAYYGDEPIAYRIDFQQRDRVLCVKWSFDEKYRRASPGFYLLTQGLVASYGAHRCLEIDLFGSPDTLKDSLQTDCHHRLDFGWPACPAVSAQLSERAERDRRAGIIHHEHRSIRNLYE